MSFLIPLSGGWWGVSGEAMGDEAEKGPLERAGSRAPWPAPGPRTPQVHVLKNSSPRPAGTEA